MNIMSAEEDKSIKCVVVGDGSVGKTCMLISYATGEFPAGKYVPTIFDNYAVTITAKDEAYNLCLFDTAGQETYDRLRILSYPGSNIFLVCFSVIMPSSFQNITSLWLPELRNSSPDTVILLVGTQSDLRTDTETIQKLAKQQQKPIQPEQGERLAKKIHAAGYVECSALTQKGLKNVFDEAIMAVLQPKQNPQFWQRLLPCLKAS